MNTSLDMYAELEHLPLRAVVALVCAQLDCPTMDELPEGNQETPTARPPVLAH